MTKRVVSLFLSLLMLLTLLPVSALADDGSSASEQPAEVSASTETKKDAEKPAADKASDETNNEKSSDEKTSEGSKEKAKTPTYTVKFVAYGKTVAKKTVKEGGTVSSLPHVTLQEESHVFKGWFYKEKGKDIRFTTSTVVSRDLTVEADIVTDPSSADTESVPASEPSDDDGQKAAPAAQTDVGQDSAPAAADGEGQNPAPAATDAEGQSPAPAAADGHGQNPAPAAADGEGQNSAPAAADGEGQDPVPAATDGEGQDPAPVANDGEGQNSEDGKKDDELIKPDGAILSDGLVKASDDTKDGKDEPKDVTVTIIGDTREIDYDGQRHEVASAFSISCSDPDFDIAQLKENIIAYLNTIAEKPPVNVGTYPTGPQDLKDDQCNDDPKHYHVSYKVTQGKLTINKVAVTVSVTGRTETITYDGDSHFTPGYEVKIESDPSELYDLKDTVIRSKLGMEKNVKRDENGDVTFYPTGFSKPDDWNKNNNFTVTYKVSQGEFWILPATLTVTTGSAEDMVDPSSDGYLTFDYASYSGLMGKDEIVGIKCTGAQPLSTPGTADNTFEIVWGEGTLPGNYTVEATLGTLTVFGENVVIVDIYGGYGEFMYDGQPHTVEGFEAETKSHTYNTANVRYKGEKALSLTETDAGEYYIELCADDFENLDPEYEVTFVIREDLALIIDPVEVSIVVVGLEYEEGYTGEVIEKPAYQITGISAPDGISINAEDIEYKGGKTISGTDPGVYTKGFKPEGFTYPDKNIDIKASFGEPDEAKLEIVSPQIRVTLMGNVFSAVYTGEEHTLTVKEDGKAYLDGVKQEAPPFTVSAEVLGTVPFDFSEDDLYIRSEFSITGTEEGSYMNNNWKYHVSAVNPNLDVSFIFDNSIQLKIVDEASDAEVKVVFHDTELYYEEFFGTNKPYHLEGLPEGEVEPNVRILFTDLAGNVLDDRYPPVGTYRISGELYSKLGQTQVLPYSVVFVPANLTIKPLPLTVNITGESAIVPYLEGTAQKVEGISTEIVPDPVLEGKDFGYPMDYMTFTDLKEGVEFVAEGTNPGDYYMGIQENWFRCKDSNYDITYSVTDGHLQIVENASYYTAELTPVVEGFEELDEIQYMNKTFRASSVTVEVKDNGGQYVEGFTVDTKSLKYIYTKNGSTNVTYISDVGQYNVEVNPESQIKVRNADGTDVTALFDVRLNPKQVSIIPRQLEITVTGTIAQAYAIDGNTATATGYTLEETLNGSWYGFLGKKFTNPVSSDTRGFDPSGWYTPWRIPSVTAGPAVERKYIGLGDTIQFVMDASRTNWDVKFTYVDGYAEVLPAPEDIVSIEVKMGPNQTLTYDGQPHQILPVAEVDAGETEVTLGEMTVVAEGSYTYRYIGTMDMTIGEKQYKLVITFESPRVSIATVTHGGTPNVAYSKVISAKVTDAADGTNVTGLFKITIDTTQSELKINQRVIKLRLRNDHTATLGNREVIVTDDKEYGEPDGSKSDWLVVPSNPDGITADTLLKQNGVWINTGGGYHGYKKGALITLSREKETELSGQNVGLYPITVSLTNSCNYWDGDMEYSWDYDWHMNELDSKHTYCYRFVWDDAQPSPSATPANYYFQITPAPVTFTAEDKTKDYGDPDPQLTVKVKGLIQGEKLSQDKDFGYDISRDLAGTDEGEWVGAYPIRVMTWALEHAEIDPGGGDEMKKAAKQAKSFKEESASERRVDESAWEVITPINPPEDEIDEGDGEPLTSCGHFDHHNYKFTEKEGVLKIYEDLTLTGADGEWPYDGEEHSNPEVTVTDGELSGNDKLTAQATGTIKDPGTAENPVGDDYAITRDGKSTISYTVNKEEITDDLMDYYTVKTIPGTLTITGEVKPGAITLTAASDTKVYDGTALTNPEVKLTKGSLLEGDTLTATADGSATNVADTASGNNPVASYQIMRGDKDVTEEYTVTTIDGTLTITPRTITLRSASAAKSYDGTPLRRNVPSRDITIGGQGFAAGEGASYSITGSQTEVGSSRNAFTYSLNAGTIAGNYRITTSYGRLRIFDENILDEEVPLGMLGSFSFYFISDTDLAKEGKKNDAYKDIFAWIKENNARLGALAIVGSGNAVLDRNEKAAWKLIKSELANLKRSKNQLPYLNVAGENEVGGDELDYKTYSKNRLCEVSKKNEYNDGQIWYQPFPEQQLLFVGIGYEKLIDPQTATEEEKELEEKWVNAANSMINKYPEYSVVLVMNDFIEHDPASQKDDGRLTEFGKFIEEKLVAPNGNVALVLCGSAEGTARWTKKYGDRNVNAVMYNYQDDEENGLGFFRIITLNGEAGTITVSTYSPTLDKDSYDENNPDYDFYVIHDAF